MQNRFSRVTLAAFGALFAFAACDSTPTDPASDAGQFGVSRTVDTTGFPKLVVGPAIPGSPTATEVIAEGVVVCKYGTDASFDYSWVDQDDTNITGGGTVAVADGECWQLLFADRGGAIADVTEDLTSLPLYGQLDSVKVSVRTGVSDAGATVVTTKEAGPTVSGPARGGGVNGKGVLFEFFNSIVPPGGGEGCTPGYWKNHAGPWSLSQGGQKKPSSWEGYLPTDSYDAVFGVTSSFGAGFTLIDALDANGGGESALARHAVAALLSAAHSGVSYDLTTADVINGVQAAYASGDFEAQKDVFAPLNEQGCPL